MGGTQSSQSPRKSSEQSLAPGPSYRKSTKSLLSMKYQTVKLSFQDEEAYRRAAQATIGKAWKLLNDPSWKMAKQQDDDLVYTMSYRSKPGMKEQKIYKVVARMGINAARLKDDFWFNVNEISNWNTALLESHRMCLLDDYTDIIYQITASSTTSLVTSREFVNLRSWGVIEGYYVIAHQATEFPVMPIGQKFIRAENGVSCVAFQIDPNDMTKCLMHFVFNSDLKGWIPQYLLDVAIIDVLIKYLSDLRGHIADMLGTPRPSQVIRHRTSV